MPGWTGELTGRERAVAELISQGLSDKEIARRLRISVCTVRSHLRAIFAKAGCRNRTQVAVFYAASPSRQPAKGS